MNTTWTLQVEKMFDQDEYFVSLPNDLLSAAGLTEEDVVEWIDNNDGSFTLKKVD